MIFDTNVLIYISKKTLTISQILSPDIRPAISVISYMEALGFQFKTNEEKYYIEQICLSCQLINLNEQIVKETIIIRSRYKIKLPDAIIYATALIENQPLLTNNIDDFSALDGKVELINPFTL